MSTIWASDGADYLIPLADTAKVKVGQLVVLEEIDGGYRIKDENNTNS